MLRILDFTELDREIAKLKILRNSYYASNKEYYGEYLSALLND